MDEAGTTPELVGALRDIEAAAHEAIARNRQIVERVQWLVDELARNPRLKAILESEPRPLIIEMVTANLRTWHDKGAQLRRAQARTLRREGLTMEDIAGLFGVTKQRISALLRDAPATDPDQRGS